MNKNVWDSFITGDDDTETLYCVAIINDNCRTLSGDLYTGEFYRENLTWYFKVIDKNGLDYDTTEQPIFKRVHSMYTVAGENK
jgi:hypothetical protein